MASPYWLIPVSQVWDTAFGARKARIGVYPEEGGSVQQKSQDASGYDDGYRSYLEEK